MNDNQLMSAVRDGDCDSLGKLFERHHRKLYNYFLKHTGDRLTSEDLVQEVFLRMLKYRGSYRGGGDDGFTAWMYRIARNTRFTNGSRKRPEELSMDTAMNIADNRPGPDQAVETADEIDTLRRALALLPEDDRELIILSKYQEMRYRDIGRVLDCSEGAVKVRVFRALGKLADKFHLIRGETCHEL